jgi:ABC-type bacteriocin/lantibiotic exporter with double-glycine peptidase domain
VPFLAQSELLCGGAALAMVERWWGRRGVYAEDFAALVRPEEGGIRTTDLAAAAKRRGWETTAFDGTPELVRQSLAGGVPVVALIEVAPHRYHYVVLLGWSAGRVVFHDPARAPSTSVDEASFLARWTGGEPAGMLIHPSSVSDQNTSARRAASRA